MKRVYEVTFEQRENGVWQSNFSSRTVIARDLSDALERAQTLEEKLTAGLIVRPEEVRLITKAE